MSNEYSFPIHKSLIISLGILAIEGLKDCRILEVRHWAKGDADKADWLKDPQFRILVTMQETLRSTQRLCLKEFGWTDSRVSDKLAWTQQAARISYAEWEAVFPAETSN